MRACAPSRRLEDAGSRDPIYSLQRPGLLPMGTLPRGTPPPHSDSPFVSETVEGIEF